MYTIHIHPYQFLGKARHAKPINKAKPARQHQHLAFSTYTYTNYHTLL